MAKPKTVSKAASNPTIKYAKVMVDGEIYALAFSFNSIAVAEESANVNLLKALGSLKDLTALQFRGLLYAALVDAQPDTTIESAGSLIRLDTMGLLQDKLAEAYINSMPQSKPESNPQKPVEAA